MPNIKVLSISSSNDNLIVAMRKAVKSSWGDWFFDELLLPGKPGHKDFAEQLTELVEEMKTEGRRLWIAVAEIKTEGNPRRKVKLDPFYLKNYLFALKGQKGNLKIPLHSCRSVLKHAGLAGLPVACANTKC